MIPAILHAVLVGSMKLTDLNARCLASWLSVLGNQDYRFRFWRDWDDWWTQRALSAGNYVGACNRIRMLALRQYGGVYVDLDVEILKPFDLTRECFIGWQRDDTIDHPLNTAVMGAVPNHWFVSELVRLAENLPPEFDAITQSTQLPYDLLLEHGLTGMNARQCIRGVDVYPKDFFHPFRWDQGYLPDNITPKTVCVHHWQATWKPEGHH